MAGARHDVDVGIAQPLRRITHRANAAFVKGRRVELADDFAGEFGLDIGAEFRRALHKLLDHGVQLVEQMGAHIHGKDDFAGDDVPRIRVDVDMADGAHGVGLVLHRDLVDEFRHQCEAPARVLAHMHGRGAGVALLARHRAFDPAQALPVGDNTDVLALGLQNRTLFDVQFKECLHLAVADFLGTLPADALQFVAKPFAVSIDAVVGPLQLVLPGKDTRGQHGGSKAGALLIGPVGHNNRVPGLDAQVIERADDLQPAEHAQNPVILPAGGLCIEV